MPSDRDERFEALYRKHYRRVIFYYVRVNHLSLDDAQDLAQDAFLRFFEVMDEYRGEAEWAYLELVARSVYLNRVRSAGAVKRSANLVSIGDLLPTQEPIAKPEADYVQRQAAIEGRRRFRQAFSDLPKAQQQCIHLRMQGFKYNQIARVLGITLDAVKTRLREAKKTMRARLGDDAGSADWLDLPEEEQ